MRPHPQFSSCLWSGGWSVEVWQNRPPGRTTGPRCWRKGRDGDGDIPRTWTRPYRTAGRARRVCRSLMEQGAWRVDLCRADGGSWSWVRPGFHGLAPFRRTPTAAETERVIWDDHDRHPHRKTEYIVRVLPNASDGRGVGVMLHRDGDGWAGSLWLTERFTGPAHRPRIACDLETICPRMPTPDDAVAELLRRWLESLRALGALPKEPTS